MIIHIPHSSLTIPIRYRKDFLLSDKELKMELLKMTDSYTDVLFDAGFPSIVFPVSRLVCDTERFRNDADEPMSAKGMGAVYTVTSDNRLLKKLTPQKKVKILARYYDPHHARLEGMVNKALDRDGFCLIVDAHSFASRPMPHEPSQSEDRPDYCIGTDEFHTPKKLSDMIWDFFEQEGRTAKINDPFSGAIVPARYYRKDRNVMSVMIEINRRLYMEETTGERNAAFADTRRTICSLLNLISEWEISECMKME